MEYIGKHWYALNVVGGKEIKVRDWLIDNRVKFGVTDEVLDEVVLPIQRKVILRNGKKTLIESSLTGPHVYIHAVIDREEVVYFLMQAPYVYGFVGSKKGGFRSGAERLNSEEINRILNNDVEEYEGENVEYSSGDDVEIISGLFVNFKGVVKDVDKKTNMLKISVMIFGGENLVEISSSQVKKINAYG